MTARKLNPAQVAAMALLLSRRTPYRPMSTEGVNAATITALVAAGLLSRSMFLQGVSDFRSYVHLTSAGHLYADSIAPDAAERAELVAGIAADTERMEAESGEARRLTARILSTRVAELSLRRNGAWRP